ncbi:site-specific integrase [Aliagarivorans taiwanensis]|uniref:site-specific integrase n=1 Tax=Aliagarivorans taiwanensis TaxID=561966 RepID=UPI0004221218|nr:site-specific integrase [Aliagarivorans taiwanensis]
MGEFDQVKVKEYKYQGRSFVTLINQHCCPPCPYVANYINIGLSGKAHNTKARYVRELLFVLTHFSCLNPKINLVKRVNEGKFLTLGEINKFTANAKFMSDSELSNVVTINRYSQKSLENAIHASRVSGARVKADTARGRIKRLADYLRFLYQEAHSDCDVPEIVAERHRQVQFMLGDEAKTLRDFEDICIGFSESVIPADVFFRLLEIIQPTSEDNPFKHSRIRNMLIVLLFLETGLRRGAVAKLKIEHFKFWGSFDEITITRNPDDPTDSRSKRPRQKTKAHRVFCPPELMRQIKNYIDSTRLCSEGSPHNSVKT